ncbi:MAG: hypothetical protein Q8Q28_08610 [Pseudomonadota bacterium]|nr:hypothetical protein [Pseudomonadota bacterium]
MKKLAVPFALSLLLATSQVWAHTDHLKPQFGGVTADAESFQVELVFKGAEAMLYLTEHGAPVESTGASGKLIVLSGKNKEEVTLAPNGYQTLGAKLNGKPAKGAKAVATITVPSRGTGNVRFTLK